MTWQLISVNINRQTSDDIEVIKGKLLGLEHTRNGTPAILSVHETKSWDIPNLELKGFMCYGNKNGYASVLVSDKFSTIISRLFFESGAYTDIPMTKCTKNVLQMWLKFCAKAVRVAKNFYTAGDINVDFSLMCTDENEERSSRNCMVPYVGKGTTRTCFFFCKEKNWWYGIMKEFDCQVSSR